MASWQDGYVTDIPYTAGFYRELSPPYLHLMALLMGIRPPIEAGRPFAYAELGCGQGLGTLLLAAANPLGTFAGFDFNPAQIAKADDLARRAGVDNVRFRERSFESLATEADDGERYDLIVLHGIYSWVSEPNRGHIVAFIRDRLRPGGMVYVSYNCMPGWASFAPVQRLMREFVGRRRGRSDESVALAIEFAKQLAAGGARYFAQNESAARQLELLAGKSRTYLAHEYLNEHWAALYHVDVARDMEEARLGYVGSATISDNVAALNAPGEIGRLLGGADPPMAETIRDFAANRRFRRDLYVRGPVRLSAAQFAHAFDALSFALTVEPGRLTPVLSTAAGEVRSNGALVEPILERLKSDGRATVAELRALPSLAEVPAWRLAQTLALIVESGQAHPIAHDPGTAERARRSSASLNDVLIDGSERDDAVEFLAAPTIGSAALVAHTEQLVLLAIRRFGEDDPVRLRDFVWPALRAQGKRLLRDGEPIEDEAGNLAELQRRIAAFVAGRLPLLRRLEVVPRAGKR